MIKNKTHLTTREYVGEIVEVLSRPGFYKVKIPELTYFSKDGFIVHDESIKSRFTNSAHGSYGYFYPLQKGTKVIVKFKRNDLTSGVIEKIHSYEFPVSTDKHPNYYLITKTLSDTKIYIDDDSSELKFSHNSDTNYCTYTSSGIKNHAHNQYYAEATDKVVFKAPNIYLNGGASVSDNSKNYSPSNNPIDYPISLEDPTIGEISNALENINGYNETSARIDNKPEETQSITINNPNLTKQLNHILNTDINKNQTLTYNLTTLEDFKDNLNTKFQQIDSYISNYSDIFEQTKNEITNFLSPDDTINESNYLQTDNKDNILFYYYKLLNRHNSTVYAINQLLSSSEYTNLNDEQTEIVKSNIEFVYNTVKKSYNELITIRKSLNRDDVIYLPNDLDQPENTFDNYKTAYDYAIYTKNEIANSTIINDLNNLFNKIKSNANNRLDYMIDLKVIKFHVDLTYNKAHNSKVINSITNKLLEFKKEFYTTIDNKNINKLLQHKLFKHDLNEYINEITFITTSTDKIISKLDKLPNKVTTFSILDKSLLQEISDTSDLGNIKQAINDKIGIVSKLLSELKNTKTHNEFFNKFDSIFQTVYDINVNHLSDLKSKLLDKSHLITDVFKTVLDYIICFNSKESNNTPIKDNSIVNNEFTLNNLLDDFFKSLLDALTKLFDINISGNLDISLGNVDCLINIDDLYQKAPDSIKPYLTDIFKKHGALKSFLTQKYYKKIASLTSKTLSVLQSGNILHNNLYSYVNKSLLSLSNLIDQNAKHISKLNQISKIIKDDNLSKSINSFLSSNYKKLSTYLEPKHFIDNTHINNKQQLTLSINNTKVKFKFKKDLFDIL